MNWKKKLHFPVLKVFCSCFVVVSLSWERFKILSDFFKKAQRSLHFRVAFIQFQESVPLWLCLQQQPEMIIFPSSLCSGPLSDDTQEASSQNHGSLACITAGHMSTNWTNATNRSLLNFQWLTSITLTPPSQKESYKLYTTLYYKEGKSGISCMVTMLNCQKSGTLTSGLHTHQAEKTLILQYKHRRRV